MCLCSTATHEAFFGTVSCPTATHEAVFVLSVYRAEPRFRRPLGLRVAWGVPSGWSVVVSSGGLRARTRASRPWRAPPAGSGSRSPPRRFRGEVARSLVRVWGRAGCAWAPPCAGALRGAAPRAAAPFPSVGERGGGDQPRPRAGHHRLSSVFAVDARPRPRTLRLVRPWRYDVPAPAAEIARRASSLHSSSHQVAAQFGPLPFRLFLLFV